MSILENIYSNFVIRFNFDKFLNDITKLKLTEVSKLFYIKREYLIFNDKYFCNKKEINEWYFHKLTNIKIHAIFEFPSNLKKLTLCYRFYEEIKEIKFPKSLIKLKLTKDKYNESQEEIPKNLKITFVGNVFCDCGFRAVAEVHCRCCRGA